MIGTISIKCNAAHPNMALPAVYTYVSSPSSIRILDVPKKIGKWQITEVDISFAYPNGEIVYAQCALVGGAWVGTIQETDTAGTSENGFTIFANGIDENGHEVLGYILGKGDLTVLEADGTLRPLSGMHYVKLLNEENDNLQTGDMFRRNDMYYICQDGEARQIGASMQNVADYVNNQLSDYVQEDAFRNAVSGVEKEIDDINALIPEQALSSNQLADKAFVNSTVQTATANFRGNWQTWFDVPTQSNEYPPDYTGSTVPTVNDYMVVQDASGDDAAAYYGTWRYKYSGVWNIDGKDGWIAEYQVNETPMTAAQLAALNSGITAPLVQQFKNKQDKLTDQQINTIAGITDERITVVKYSGGAISSFSINGTLSRSSIPNVSYVVEVVIGSGVTSIGVNAFGGCDWLSSVTIPNSVTSIEMHAFNDCPKLTSVKIPGSVKNIGNEAFKYCNALSNLIIESGVLSIDVGAFNPCRALTSVTIPDGVKSIGRYAFSGCDKLSSVTIPDSVTSIGQWAFAACPYTSLTIGSGVSSIGPLAFLDAALTDITFRGKTVAEVQAMENYPWGIKASALSSMQIHSDIDIRGSNIKSLMPITQQDYQALSSIDPSILYLITY